MTNSIDYLNGVAYANEQLSYGVTIEELELRSLGEDHPFDRGVMEVLSKRRVVPFCTVADKNEHIDSTVL